VTTEVSDRPLIAVLDYGIGNLRSAQKGLERVGADARLTADRSIIDRADAVVLPGVGAFGRCVEALRDCGLEAAALDAVASGRPFLGICIGMQLLFDRSDEDPDARGLGVIPGSIHLLPEGVKRPQMQWNVLDVVRPSPAARRARGQGVVYFVHSCPDSGLRPLWPRASNKYGGCGGRDRNVRPSSPESRPAGLRLLSNFVDRARVDGLYPSIDLRAGQVVRLYQGDYARDRTATTRSRSQRASPMRARGGSTVDLDGPEPVSCELRVAAMRRGRRCARRERSGTEAAAAALPTGWRCGW
jgi:glutamine amidotransferase